ncbi:DUF3152 domain-containing protein [Streptomyces sp. NPDC048751]|uniref:DUF3152 domain-containing protein n=1 Tax=Streptomyces sp. NPDC048751 TaxID=3365591 RepID=UPI003721A0B9
MADRDRIPGPASGRQTPPTGGTTGYGGSRRPDGTPAHGVPRLPDGTPAQGVPHVRGGHPEQREPGGGWGGGARGRSGGTGPVIPRQRRAPGPRQEYLDAFGQGDGAFASRERSKGQTSALASGPHASATDWDAAVRTGDRGGAGDAPPSAERAPAKGTKGRTFTGIAAAAVTTVLAVVVAGQVTHGDNNEARSQSATDQAKDARGSGAGVDGQASPSAAPDVVPLTYEQKMGTKYPLGAKLKGSGKFDVIPGVDKAPGKGQKYTYRVDVEQGLGLDGALFAQAVQKTLNDNRSWAHDGALTFERISTGKPDFVITLASPGTTADWCAKSSLDITEDNVSCDSASTERVMINAYRWAQGSKTYGDQIYAYRQMLINHEVGHRLGHGHVTCDKDGELAPVMQQQTKFLDHDGIHCRPNPWAYPGS